MQIDHPEQTLGSRHLTGRALTLLLAGLSIACGVLLAISAFRGPLTWNGRTTPCNNASGNPAPAAMEASCEITRIEPGRFPKGTHLPPYREEWASGPLRAQFFLPEKDLIRVANSSVWWESDANPQGPEDDHVMNAAMEAPFTKMADLVGQHGGTLEVRDSYRSSGVHNRGSLHREGRALDLTCRGITLEKLARLCWLAGFDWVYYEADPAHIHCSVRAWHRTDGLEAADEQATVSADEDATALFDAEDREGTTNTSPNQ